jgi:hypothetical protein
VFSVCLRPLLSLPCRCGVERSSILPTWFRATIILSFSINSAIMYHQSSPYPMCRWQSVWGLNKDVMGRDQGIKGNKFGLNKVRYLLPYLLVSSRLVSVTPMYLICKIMLIICLKDPKSLLQFKIRIQIRSFHVLYSVDRLALSVIFENLLESNSTTLPNEKLFLITCSARVQIYKNYSVLEVFVSRVQTELYNPVFRREFSQNWLND